MSPKYGDIEPSFLFLSIFYYRFYPFGDNNGKCHLYQIRNDEGKHTPSQDSKQSYFSGILHIKMHEPGCSKSIANYETKNKCCYFDN